MKKYFDQEALLFPIEDIINKVEERDYRFFLKNKNFLKVVDTLEKFQRDVVEIDSAAGREFIVFKRQLYQLYEIQNRSVEEHEAFSFEIERENLKWLWNAKQDFAKEMDKENLRADLQAHAHLKGNVFKRKTMDPTKLYGLGYFGLSAVSYSLWPHMVNHVGSTLSYAALLGGAFMGMTQFHQKDLINSIKFIREGEHKGKIAMNIATSPFSSKTLIAEAGDIQGMCSLGNDGLGDDGIDTNLVHV